MQEFEKRLSKLILQYTKYMAKSMNPVDNEDMAITLWAFYSYVESLNSLKVEKE